MSSGSSPLQSYDHCFVFVSSYVLSTVRKSGTSRLVVADIIDGTVRCVSGGNINGRVACGIINGLQYIASFHDPDGTSLHHMVTILVGHV